VGLEQAWAVHAVGAAVVGKADDVEDHGAGGQLEHAVVVRVVVSGFIDGRAALDQGEGDGPILQAALAGGDGELGVAYYRHARRDRVSACWGFDHQEAAAADRGSAERRHHVCDAELRAAVAFERDKVDVRQGDAGRPDQLDVLEAGQVRRVDVHLVEQD